MTYMPKLSLKAQSMPMHGVGERRTKSQGRLLLTLEKDGGNFLYQVTPSVTIIAPFKQTMKAAV